MSAETMQGFNKQTNSTMFKNCYKKEFTTHKINYKQTLTNYQPVFFILVCSNIFNELFAMLNISK